MRKTGSGGANALVFFPRDYVSRATACRSRPRRTRGVADYDTHGLCSLTKVRGFDPQSSTSCSGQSDPPCLVGPAVRPLPGVGRNVCAIGNRDRPGHRRTLDKNKKARGIVGDRFRRAFDSRVRVPVRQGVPPPENMSCARAPQERCQPPIGGTCRVKAPGQLHGRVARQSSGVSLSSSSNALDRTNVIGSGVGVSLSGLPSLVG